MNRAAHKEAEVKDPDNTMGHQRNQRNSTKTVLTTIRSSQTYAKHAYGQLPATNQFRDNLNPQRLPTTHYSRQYGGGILTRANDTGMQHANLATNARGPRRLWGRNPKTREAKKKNLVTMQVHYTTQKAISNRGDPIQ